MGKFNLGEPTSEAADMSDEELSSVLADADTTALDEAADQEYGAYLQQWSHAIRVKMGGDRKRKSWNEADHPRGQPENAGEFVPKEGPRSGGSQEGSPPALPQAKKVKFGKSKAKVRINSMVSAMKTDTILHLVANGVDAASLVGAPDDAEITADLVETTTGAELRIHIKHAAFTAERRIVWNKKKKTRRIINDEFWVKDEAQGKGLGADVFGRQIENAVEAGIESIECHAAKKNPRQPDKPHNGYYTWPRFGYDQDVFDLPNSLRRDVQRVFPNAESVLDVMDTPEGREWWRKNGDDLYHAKFDLSEGSRSRRIFDAYLEERAARKKSMMHNERGNRENPHVEEIILNEEQEAALDRAWVKLSASKTRHKSHVDQPRADNGRWRDRVQREEEYRVLTPEEEDEPEVTETEAEGDDLPRWEELSVEQKKNWDESKHPRDHGQFSEKESVGSKAAAREALRNKKREVARFARKVEHTWQELPYNMMSGDNEHLMDRLQKLTDDASEPEMLHAVRREATRLSSELATRQPYGDEEMEDDRKEAVQVLRDMAKLAGRGIKAHEELAELKRPLS